METSLFLAERRLIVYKEDPFAPVFYTFSAHQEARELFETLPAPRPTVVCVDTVDWARDLSPWKSTRVFRGGEDFSGGGDAFLSVLLHRLLPAVEKDLFPAYRGIFGYSLAGLFSLWAMTKTDAFSRCASVSGSLWFDGFAEYLSAHPLLGTPDKVYLSLGDREEKVKNPRMQTVRTATETAARIIENQGISCTFELNMGGHFQDVLARQKKAVLWTAS